MKVSTRSIVIASLLVLVAGVQVALGQMVKIYVSPQGQAGWTGKLAAPNKDQTDGPLPSLAAARDLLRTLRKPGSRQVFHVVLRDGTYYLPETFELDPVDSGSVYEAYPGEHPVVSGGKLITGWQQTANKKIWTAPYAETTTQLFVNGSRAVRARTPNNGYLRIDGASSKANPFELHYKGDDIKPEWANSGAEVVVLLAWAEMRRPIVAVDPVKHIATLGGPARSSTREDTARYWIENAPGGVDSDGEWQQDAVHGTISYFQRREEDPSKAEFIAPRLSPLVILKGDPASGQLVHDVEFRGIAFRHSAWVMPEGGFPDSQAATAADSAFQAVGATRIKILDCSFSALGGYAIHLQRGSTQDVVDGNTFFDLGAGAIRIGEQKVAATDADIAKDNAFTDNEVHDIGLVYPSTVAIWVGQSSGNNLSHNHLYRMPYTAISVGWTWGYGKSTADHTKIEFNNIHDIGSMLSDLGAVYLLGMQPGTVVRNNLIHNVSTFTYGGWGIYLDEGTSNVVVENNIVYDTQSSGFHQHYGRDNMMRNNIFAFGTNYQIMRTRPETTLAFTFDHNIILYDQGSLLGYSWVGSGTGYKMDHNIYYDLRGKAPMFADMTWAQWQEKGNDPHSAVVDPQFVDPLSFDFRLKPGSPALKMGFRQIDMRTVGPQPRGVGRVAK